jgi:hypothetical protein
MLLACAIVDRYEPTVDGFRAGDFAPTRVVDWPIAIGRTARSVRGNEESASLAYARPSGAPQNTRASPAKASG